MVGIGFYFVLLLFSPFVQQDITVITILFSLKYISRVNFDSTYRKYSATWTENRKN